MRILEGRWHVWVLRILYGPRVVILRWWVLLVARPVHIGSQVTVGRERGRSWAELGVLITAISTLRDPITGVV